MATEFLAALTTVRTAPPTEAERCFDVLTRAFESDPVCRWLWPDRARYRQIFPVFSRAFGGAAFAERTACRTEDGAGVALWLPPGVAPDEETLTASLERTVEATRRGAAFELFDRMAAYHPSEPHWHLPLIGVDPSAQGRGLGTALLSRALERCDQDGAPAYLEGASPRNIVLYQRVGFRALGTIQADDCPPVTPMIREPR